MGSSLLRSKVSSLYKFRVELDQVIWICNSQHEQGHFLALNGGNTTCLSRPHSLLRTHLLEFRFDNYSLQICLQIPLKNCFFSCASMAFVESQRERLLGMTEFPQCYFFLPQCPYSTVYLGESHSHSKLDTEFFFTESNLLK